MQAQHSAAEEGKAHSTAQHSTGLHFARLERTLAHSTFRRLGLRSPHSRLRARKRGRPQCRASQEPPMQNREL